MKKCEGNFEKRIVGRPYICDVITRPKFKLRHYPQLRLLRFPWKFLTPVVLLAAAIATTAQDGSDKSAAVCAACIHQNLDYLAGPELHGRGSGTPDEYHAAQYIAAQLRHYGLAPAAENGEYIQTATIKTRAVTTAPVLSFDNAGKSASWKNGNEFAAVQLPEPDVSAQLQKLDLSDSTTSPSAVKAGAAVLFKVKLDATRPDVQRAIAPYRASKAALLIVPEVAGAEAMFQRLGSQLPRAEKRIGDTPAGPDMILLKNEAAQQLWSVQNGTVLKLHADVTAWTISHTWNVLAKIEGSQQKQHIILLSAHLDHLGVRDGKMYPGADDDASGTVAVMELARALAKETRPQRTLVFALFGSEETGLLGSQYFLKHPPFPLDNLVANLNFEMIGRADAKVKPNELWLTGWERTNLGPELASHGAQLVADPHPEENFFMRSDNYALARDGIVAQTVSSYGLHKDYHQPTDTLDKVDWQHLDSAIGSMIAPISWLANSDFTPQWNKGEQP